MGLLIDGDTVAGVIRNGEKLTGIIVNGDTVFSLGFSGRITSFTARQSGGFQQEWSVRVVLSEPARYRIRYESFLGTTVLSQGIAQAGALTFTRPAQQGFTYTLEIWAPTESVNDTPADTATATTSTN